MHYADIEAWLEALQALEADWFAPLLAALRDGALATLEIHPCKGRSFHVTRGGLRRFWKPLRPYELSCRVR
jgi:hypothetical protein